MSTYNIDESKTPFLDPKGFNKTLDNAHLWRVGKDFVNDVEVSTVFLSLDHSFDNTGPPLLFETMVFPNPLSRIECYCARYSLWDEAIAGHEKAIKWVKDTANQPTKESDDAKL